MRTPALGAQIEPDLRNFVTKSPGRCSLSKSITVPSTSFFDDIWTRYPFSEAGLQIFESMTMPCAGYITEWKFISRTPIVFGLHLGVFRRRGYNAIDLIGETFFDAKLIGSEFGRKWTTFQANPPIAVEQGDMIGMYYTNLKMRSSTLSIPSRNSDPFKNENGKTLVFLADKRTIDGKSLNIKNAIETDRVPALKATVSDLKLAPTTTLGPSQCDSATQVLPADFRHELPDASVFDQFEAGLQVFKYMKIPCSGKITEWKFVSKSKIVYGLHLAVFRQNEYDTTMELVGATELNYEPPPGTSSESDNNAWIALNADPPINVRKGDLIGMYYDKLRTTDTFLTLPSSSDASILAFSGEAALSTYVWLLDKSAFKNKSMVFVTKLEPI